MGRRLGQSIHPIAQVRAVLPKLLEQRDHLGDLLLTQDRQLQIKEFPGHRHVNELVSTQAANRGPCQLPVTLCIAAIAFRRK